MATEKTMEFELFTPHCDHVTTMQVPVTDGLRAAVNEQLQVMALAGQSEARFTWTDYQPVVDDVDTPRLDGVEFGIMRMSDGDEVGFFLTGFEKHVGTELNSLPVKRGDAPGLDDLVVDPDRVAAARRILGLSDDPVTLVQWSDPEDGEAGGVIALDTDPAGAWDFVNEWPQMSEDLRESHDLPTSDFEIQNVYMVEDYFIDLLSGAKTVHTDSVRAAAGREENVPQ